VTTAAHWHALETAQVACDLCPVDCHLRPGQTGPCGTRANENGVMVPLHYGRIVSSAVDPIEKKPLYHFHPGRSILSVAAPGCNLHCLFCQNWSISQERTVTTVPVTPDDLVAQAQALGSLGIAFTYSEPLVWFEFVRDTAEAARAAGLKNVLVTNGYLNPEPLAELLPLIDAANIDLKSMDDGFYRDVCRASLDPVLHTIRQAKAAGVHLELTNLVIPGYNDRADQIGRLVDFVADLDPETPLHFSAYRPAWKLKARPTTVDDLLRARAIAERKLPWVYLGNVVTDQGRDSQCPDCSQLLVRRAGYRAEVKTGAGPQCEGCGRKLPFILT